MQILIFFFHFYFLIKHLGGNNASLSFTSRRHFTQVPCYQHKKKIIFFLIDRLCPIAFVTPTHQHAIWSIITIPSHQYPPISSRSDGKNIKVTSSFLNSITNSTTPQYHSISFDFIKIKKKLLLFKNTNINVKCS